ncbi:MAG: flagellar hook-length control protein FliK, partial [Lachnospiraceae bacterium]|nr:flagellar hook-length control protein FliK [Lachnospiraceae bacterium]
VGNVMANKGLTDLKAAIAPPSATKEGTGFGDYIQKTLDNQKTAESVSGAIKTDSGKGQSVQLQQDSSNSIEPVRMKTNGAQEQGGLTKDQFTAVNQEIRNAVKTALGVDEETMEAVLAEMGIMPIELLQPENLQQFILMVDGGQEITDFLMNEEMMGDFNLVSEVLQALDMTEITDTPMAEILQQMTQLSEGIPTDMVSLSDDVLADSLSQDSELPLSQETAGELQEEPEVVVVQQENSDRMIRQTAPEESQVLAEDQGQTVTSVSLSDSTSQNASKNMGNSDASQQESQLPEQFTSVRPEPEPEFIAASNHFQQQMVADSVSEIAAPQPTPQIVQIVEQIVEQIRIHAQADTTTMEMQLNPESLGKVLLTISNRAGMMTANFTVQTEEARMAVESQMYTLRENLEQKELKVDAVEVTVSNFEFTQRGENGGDQKDLNQGDGRSRRFRMEEQEEDGEEISQEAEAERVRRNVMRDNGGSVDFIA